MFAFQLLLLARNTNNWIISFHDKSLKSFITWHYIKNECVDLMAQVPTFTVFIVNLVLSSGAKMETLIIPAPSTKYLLITCLKLSKTVLGRLAAGRVTSRGGYPVLRCRRRRGGWVERLPAHPAPPRPQSCDFPRPCLRKLSFTQAIVQSVNCFGFAFRAI